MRFISKLIRRVTHHAAGDSVVAPGMHRLWQTPEKRRLKHYVWVLGLAAFLTSVTIASIPSRESVAPDGTNGLRASPPPQTVALAGKSGDITLAHVRPADINGETTDDITQGRSDAGVVNENWRETTVRRGDTLSGILRREGLFSSGIDWVVRTNPDARALYRLIPGNKLKIRTDDLGRIQELVYHVNKNETLHLKREADGFDVSVKTRLLETRLAYVTGSIETSLFQDGQIAGLSNALIMKLVEIFGWDIDFALDLRRGDSFSVIYEEKYWQGQKVADGRILAAEFVNRGRVYRAIAYRNAKGYTAYYTPSGKSVRRQFLRTPVVFSRISSRYSKGRFHPVLKRWRAHKGVDYAARTGTPVRATAEGRVVFKGWKGGYGKTIIIKHGGTFSTLYAHQSRFKRNIRVGSLVQQGQIIGYVGKTGLVTGPHLHYEFRVNGIHRNPLTFRFPAAKPISAKYRQDFQREARLWSAKLDFISRNILVASSK